MKREDLPTSTKQEHAAAAPGHPAPDSRPGMLNRLIYRVFSRELTVASAETLALGLRLITFQDDSLRGFDWVPGMKMQVAMGSALVVRTYTPMSVDPERGQLQVLAYAHGKGPGSRWVSGLKPGDTCNVFGPSSSQDLRFSAERLLLVGDETSIGLSQAASRRHRNAEVRHLFEAFAEAPMRSLLQSAPLAATGVTAQVYERAAGDVHLDAMEREVLAFARQDGAHIVLTGRASTIQRLRQALRQQGFPNKQLSTKAFWADGKKGLD